MTFTPPDSHTLSRSMRVAAPPAKIWELITTVATIVEWYDTWDAVEHAPDDERLREGTSFRLVRHRIGRNDTALCRVTAVEAPWRLCWLQHAHGLPPVLVEFQLFTATAGATDTWIKHTRTWMESDQPLS